MKTDRVLLLAALAALSGCYAPPISDAQVAAVAKTCEAAGQVVRVFNGTTSHAYCEAKKP